jgi:PAS domain S-box-containing protein
VDITQRIKAEKELANTKILLQSAFEQTPVPMVLVRAPDAGFLNVNRACVEMLGIEDEGDPRGLSLMELNQTWQDFDPEGRRVPRTELPLALALQGVTTKNRELSVQRKDGTRRWEIVNAAPIYNEAGERIAAFAVFLDITEQKRAEEALRESEEKFRNLVETTSDWIWETDAKGNYSYASPRVRDLLGYEPDEVIGRKPFDFMPADEAERLASEFVRITAERRPIFNLENVNLRKDGNQVILETSGVPRFDPQGNFLGYRGIDRDITDRRRAEEALRQSEKQYRSVIENIQDVFYRSAFNGRLIMVSPSGIKMFGYDSLDEMIGMPLDSFWPDPKGRERLLAEIKETGSVRDHEAVIKRKDGTTFNASFTTHFYYDDRGNLLGTEGIIRDITERKRAEKSLRESEAKYRRLYRTMTDAFVRVDLAGRILEANHAYQDLLGYSEEELYRMKYIDLTPEKWHAFEADIVEQQILVKGHSPVYEKEYRRKDGSTFPVELRTFLISDEAGQPTGMWAIVRDITERKRSEEALRKSEEEAKRLAQETTIMAEIGKIISSTLNIEEVYERFVAEVRMLIPFDRIAINVKEPGENKVKIVYISGVDVPGHRPGSSFPLANSFTGEVIRTRSSLMVNPEAMKERINQFTGYLPIYQAGFRALISVPLFSRDELIGVMNLSSTGQIPYTERDLRLAEKVGNQISGAIGNALIFAELKRVEEELRMAQMVLEARVRERTADLVKINEELQAEIIERKNAEESLKKAKEGAEAASIAKSAFLANMSHEVRTPLNAIIGFSELMADGQAGELNETQKEYLADVLQSGHHLLSLINDILDLSKVEAGKMELELEDVSLRALLQGSLVMVKEKALKHGLEISGELNGIPDPIMADKRKMKQVLFNLLCNAVKFTPDGGRVGIQGNLITRRQGRWVKEDGRSLDYPIPVDFETADRRPWALISVEDTGIGIEKGNLERIFDPFEQVDCTASRRFQGTGLGLALTRRFVELHGGKVWAESRGLGKGSAFRFLIPISQLKEEDGRS